MSSIHQHSSCRIHKTDVLDGSEVGENCQVKSLYLNMFDTVAKKMNISHVGKRNVKNMTRALHFYQSFRIETPNRQRTCKMYTKF